MGDWIRSHPGLWTALGVFSVVSFLLGLLLVPLVVTRMRADYFTNPSPPAPTPAGRHPALRGLARVGKNLLGALLVLAGLAMLVLPGQGILTILLGLAFLDLPGKRRAELWLVSRPPVLAAVNRLRLRAGRELLRLPPSS
jgi:hypothetical protein